MPGFKTAPGSWARLGAVQLPVRQPCPRGSSARPAHCRGGRHDPSGAWRTIQTTTITSANDMTMTAAARVIPTASRSRRLPSQVCTICAPKYVVSVHVCAARMYVCVYAHACRVTFHLPGPPLVSRPGGDGGHTPIRPSFAEIRTCLIPALPLPLTHSLAHQLCCDAPQRDRCPAMAGALALASYSVCSIGPLLSDSTLAFFFFFFFTTPASCFTTC